MPQCNGAPGTSLGSRSVGLGRATLVPDVEKSIEHASAPGPSRAARTALVQLHLWTRPEDVVYLRQIAAERDQTVSAVVRSIVRAYRRSRAAQGDESGTAAVRERYIRP
jgi:hypothetical protein